MLDTNAKKAIDDVEIRKLKTQLKLLELEKDILEAQVRNDPFDYLISLEVKVNPWIRTED